MAKLTKEEQALLDELTQRASEPDADDDFEIEVYDTSAGRGARVPFSKASKWLFDNFGIGDPPPAESSAAGDPPAGKKNAKDPDAAAGRAGYFGRQAG